MDGNNIIKRGIATLGLLALTSSPALAWPLGMVQNNGYWDVPPSAYGFNLGDTHPNLFGGSNYRENYSYPQGFGYATMSGPVYTPVFPLVRTRPLPPKPLPPIDYVPTSHLFPEAHFTVHVPCDAEVWLEGHKTGQTGAVRNFVTPPLNPGDNYLYVIRARWEQDGKPVEQVQRLVVQMGTRFVVRFPGPMPRVEQVPPPPPAGRAP